MRSKKQRILAVTAIAVFVLFVLGMMLNHNFEKVVIAQEKPKTDSPTPTETPEFDQKAALAKLREQIKGKENEPAEKVFKNIKSFEGDPAGRLLAIMEFGYARSLGVDCTHCHVPEKWESEEKPTKQIARDMKDMSEKINFEILKKMESLGGRQAFVNCTTCHRGDVKPALNLPDQQTKKNNSSSPEAIDTLIDQYFTAVSGKGKKDWSKLKEITLASVQFNVVGINADGTNNFHPMTLDKFIDHMTPYIEKNGFYQKGFTTQVDYYNKIAQVWCGFESRNEPGSNAIDKGIITFQIVLTNGKWKIASVMWNSETKDNKVPKEFLN